MCAPGISWEDSVAHVMVDWGPQHFQHFPWRDPAVPSWQALLAEVFLQRTRAAQAARAFGRLQQQFPTVRSLAQSSDVELFELLRPLGLRWRFPLVRALAQRLSADGGTVPQNRAGLLTLPGVGEYVAAAVLSLHLNRRAVLIDANIVRVLARLVGRTYGPETRRSRWLRELAERLTPQEQHRTYNYALLDLAMTICLPRTPSCPACPLAPLCATASRVTEGSVE